MVIISTSSYYYFSVHEKHAHWTEALELEVLYFFPFSVLLRFYLCYSKKYLYYSVMYMYLTTEPVNLGAYRMACSIRYIITCNAYILHMCVIIWQNIWCWPSFKHFKLVKCECSASFCHAVPVAVQLIYACFRL